MKVNPFKFFAMLGMLFFIQPAIASFSTLDAEALSPTSSVWGDFPAISESGGQVAIVRHEGKVAIFEIIEVANDETVLSFEFPEANAIAPQASADGHFDHMQAQLSDINAYLTDGGFQPMQPLYWIPAVDSNSSVVEILSVGWRITFDRESGRLNIDRMADDQVERFSHPFVPANFESGENIFSAAWPVNKPQSKEADPPADCVVSRVPFAGWIKFDQTDTLSVVAAFRIRAVTNDQSCDVPDEWTIERIESITEE